MAIAQKVKDRVAARVGTSIREKYRLDAVLGIGGMAAVYAATHRNGMRVALKALHPELSRMEDVRRRFLREGYVANKVNHPGVVKVLDDDVDEDQNAFLVMELLDGETLEERCVRHGKRLPATEVLLQTDRLLDVLAVAHSVNVVHRDIKPENVFLTREGQLKVLDFGIARLLDGTVQATQTGQLFGTPAFMSPEQAGGKTKEIDARSDLWSVGALMFTLLSGKSVHEHESATIQIVLAAGTNARSVASVQPDVPADVAAVVDRALAFAKDKRWSSARSMQDAVRTTRDYAAASQIQTAATQRPEPIVEDDEVRESRNPTIPLGSFNLDSAPPPKHKP